MLSGQIAMLHGREGLPEDTIKISLTGIAGQSFGAFLAPGIDLRLVGEANDYVGKGMAGGRISIRPDPRATFVWHENSIVGNTVLYGATGGEVFFAGKAGERFCVRNSGVTAVVEGTGDHGCEYMTGGTVAVLGQTGRNFAAGMSGGVAYVYDEDGEFAQRCNTAMVSLDKVLSSVEQEINVDKALWHRIGGQPQTDEALLKKLITDQHKWTGSLRARHILDHWAESRARFVKVFPHEYKRALTELAAKAAAASGDPGGAAQVADQTIAKARAGETKGATAPAK
jgi:glutamate synthase domain-containing protein 3